MPNFGAPVLQLLGSLLWYSASVHAFESLQEVYPCSHHCKEENHHALCIKATDTTKNPHHAHHRNYCVNMEKTGDKFDTGGSYVFEKDEKGEKAMYWQFDKLEIGSSHDHLRVSFF